MSHPLYPKPNNEAYEKAMAEKPTDDSLLYDKDKNRELIDRMGVVAMNSLIKTHKSAQLGLLDFDDYERITIEIAKAVRAHKLLLDEKFSKDESKGMNYMRTANDFFADILVILERSRITAVKQLFTDIFAIKINEFTKLDLLETRFSDYEEHEAYHHTLFKNSLKTTILANPDVPIYVIEYEGDTLSTHISTKIRVQNLEVKKDYIVVSVDEDGDTIDYAVPFDKTYRILVCNQYKTNQEGQRIHEKITSYDIMLKQDMKLRG